jgi:hypothetical protein
MPLAGNDEFSCWVIKSEESITKKLSMGHL